MDTKFQTVEYLSLYLYVLKLLAAAKLHAIYILIYIPKRDILCPNSCHKACHKWDKASRNVPKCFKYVPIFYCLGICHNDIVTNMYHDLGHFVDILSCFTFTSLLYTISYKIHYVSSYRSYYHHIII